MNTQRFLGYLLITILTVSCKSYSKYPIDSNPLVKMDTSLLGIWKAEKDTSKANYILLQYAPDLHYAPESSPAQRAARQGRDMKNTDTAAYNRRMDSLYKADDMERMKTKDYTYYATYFNAHGKNPLYEQWSVYTSEINKVQFLNIPYRYDPGFDDKRPTTDPHIKGYFFVRIISKNNDKLTTALVADSTLKYLKSAAAVRERIAKNINNKHFYSDTLHFYKVSNYHRGLNGSMKRANQ